MRLPVDNPLFPFIQMLHSYANAVGKARDAYLAKEALRDYTKNTLIAMAAGKSHAEKLTQAMATKEWRDFNVEVNRLQAVWEFHKLKFSVIEKEYFAQHQQLSLDGGLIKKEQ